MPTAEKTKAARESWLDWVPEEGRDEALLDAEPLLTRDELVAELRQGGEDVTARDLIFWQTVGAIPYPVKRQRQGAPRAYYPRWMISTIHLLRNLQEQGYKLREVGPFLRGDLYHRFMPQAQTPRQQHDQDKRIAKRSLFSLIEDLDPRIRSLARVQEHLDGRHVTSAELRLIDDQGKEQVYVFLTGEQHDREDDAVDNCKIHDV